MKNSKTKIISAALIVALLAVLLVLDNTKGVPPMLLTVLRKGAIYALVAVSMNLLNGFTGLFSLGQAGFMLLGAYTYAALTIPAGKQAAIYQQYPGGGVGFSVTESLSGAMGGFGLLLGVILCLLLAGIVAAALAYVIGLPVLRLKSDYLAIATLGFAEILRAVVQYAKLGPVTNGSNLLYGFTSFDDFKIGALKLSTVMPFVFSGLCIAVVVLLINSTYGRAFKAIRDDEVAAEAMGINLAKHKRMSFVISSFFAGISGALLAMYQASVQATTFKAAMTYEILLIVVIGGIGSISGSVIASFLFVGCSEWWLRFLDNETTLKSFNAKLIVCIVICVIAAGLGALFLRREYKAGAPLLKRIETSGGKKRLYVNWLGWFAVALALAVIGWAIVFIISPNLKLPLLRSGFRMVVFSIIIMVVVLFFRKGLLGDKELPYVLHRFWAWLQHRFGKSAKGGDAR